VLKLERVDLDEIAEALSDQDHSEHAWLVNPDTGEIVFWTADTGIDGHNPIDLDELDDRGLIAIHPLPSRVWYRDMVDFVEAVNDERTRRRLCRALEGRGAFRRFKDELHDEYPHLLEAWYAFRGSRANRRAVEWLVDNELIDDDAAARYLADHPDPDAP
jgi:hypothetical protein